jgi:hypothetical protein
MSGEIASPAQTVGPKWVRRIQSSQWSSGGAMPMRFIL